MASQETDKLQENEDRNSKSSGGHRALSNFQRLCYGVGHVLNDMTASMWFSYLLIFLHKVNKFDNLLAGNLMLIGQVSDALFTPFVGYESDHTRGFCNLGKRKSWHFVGTICVLASFTFIFMRCIDCANTPDIYQLIYYAPMVVIFQFGWASVQISHLSFSSDYTPYKQERVTLQSIRNLFTVSANLSLFGIFTMLFYMGETEGLGNGSELGPADAPKFRNLALISLGIGVVFTTIFYAGTRENQAKTDTEKGQEPDHVETSSSLPSMSCTQAKMTWKDWLKDIQFYQIAVLYMSTRLFINITQVYLPIYLTETVKFDKMYIALMPIFVYSSSFITSMLYPFFNGFIGRKPTYFIGLLLAAASCVWMAFIQEKSRQVYGSSVLLGAAGSVLLITSLSMISDIIATNTESGAFVFGAMSFTDKLSNGIAVVLIQKFHPNSAEEPDPSCTSYYRLVESIIPGAAVGLAFIAFLTLLPQNIGVRKRDSYNEQIYGDEDKTLIDKKQCSCGQFYVPPGSCVHCVTPGGVMVVHTDHDTQFCDDKELYVDKKINQRMQCSCGQFYVAPGSCVYCVTPGGVKVVHTDHDAKCSDSDSGDESAPLMFNGRINGNYGGILSAPNHNSSRQLAKAGDIRVESY